MTIKSVFTNEGNADNGAAEVNDLDGGCEAQPAEDESTQEISA